jgi:hypothetical protein
MFKREGTLQEQVFNVLKDKEWHCRGHEYTNVPSGQLAGGGGIQGLQRGTRRRPGFEIEGKKQYCPTCKSIKPHDRWTGRTRESNAASGVPKSLIKAILEHFDHTDAIEQRRRPPHELIIDHRFPMERWGSTESALPPSMPAEEISRKFQLLKKDDSGNHNLLKSRACEFCIKTGKRGTPLGIRFYYHGSEDWPADTPPRGPIAEKGCVGCGWYDFSRWREALNKSIDSSKVEGM